MAKKIIKKTEGYQDIAVNKRRQMVLQALKMPEDIAYRQWKIFIDENVRETLRTSGIMSFAMRAHLVYVNNISFNPDIDDEVLRYETIDKWQEYTDAADATGRFTFAELLDIIETERMVSGDVLVEILPNAQWQIWKSTEIVTPKGGQEHDFPMTGNTARRLLKDGWHSGFYFENGILSGANVFDGKDDRFISADDFVHIGYFQYADQIRGVSPLVSVCPQFRDVYEAIEAALAKAKLSQIVALVEKKEFGAFGGSIEADDAEVEAIRQTKQQWEDSGMNVTHRVIPTTDELSFHTPSTPSEEFQHFMDKTIRIALAGFDLPYSFFDSSISNYYGNRTSYRQYLETVKKKQERLILLLRKTARKLQTISPFFAGVPYHKIARFAGARFPVQDLLDNVDAIRTAEAYGYMSTQNTADLFGVNQQDVLYNRHQQPDVSMIDHRKRQNKPIT